jgi:hypothetical protein
VSAEETRVGFACNRSGEHRFTGAWRTNQQHSFWQVPPDTLIRFGVTKEIDDFLHFGFGFFDAGDVAEAGGGPFFDSGAFGFADVRLMQDKHDDEAADEERGKDADPLTAKALAWHVDLDAVLCEESFEFGFVEVCGHEELFGAFADFAGAFDAIDSSVRRGGRRAFNDLMLLNKVAELRPGDLVRLRSEQDASGNQSKAQEDHDDACDEFRVFLHVDLCDAKRLMWIRQERNWSGASIVVPLRFSERRAKR